MVLNLINLCPIFYRIDNYSEKQSASVDIRYYFSLNSLQLMLFIPNFHSRLQTTSAMSQGINSLAACRKRQLTNLRKKPANRLWFVAAWDGKPQPLGNKIKI
jgi:hypothetical protein